MLCEDQVIALVDKTTIMKHVLTVLARRATGRGKRIELDLAAGQHATVWIGAGSARFRSLGGPEIR